jgi:oxygen-independent coproporphyrinogen-3 oxidase
MAGIYIHIPFCKQACHYCDFHFSTSLKYKKEMVAALQQEIRLRKNYLPEKEPISSIYFGGGSPSLLNAEEINRLLEVISGNFELSDEVEITLEANPDDLNREQTRQLGETQINRLSIGVQSFFEEDLKWMNRAHSAMEARDAIKRVQDAGFENITADLIYGFPLLSDKKWAHNIQQMAGLGIPHISAYSMTVEDRTPLAAFIKKGSQKPMDESQSASQFLYLIETLAAEGFEQYEISNFAKGGNYSRHNTNYWKGVAYLGVGPSAHSFNGHSRQWNVSNNVLYLNSVLKESKVPFEAEKLSQADQINEYIMTALRTKWGIDLARFENLFGAAVVETLSNKLNLLQNQNHIIRSQHHIVLSMEGKLFADRIAAQLFV